MSEAAPETDTTTVEQEPAAAAPAATPAGEKKSLEDLLAGVDDSTRSAVLGAVKKAREEAANYRTKLREAEPRLTEYDKLVEASKTDQERAQEAATAAVTRAETLQKRLVSAEVRAQATEGFADPADATAFLDLAKYASEDGEVDTDAIKADLADLLTRKPHLGKTPATRVPKPNQAQGSSASGAAPDFDTQIADATKAGDHQLAIALKQRKAASLRT